MFSPQLQFCISLLPIMHQTPCHMENSLSCSKSESTCTQMWVDVQQVDFVAYFL